MPIAIQTSTITGNTSATFTFPGAIGAYVYALQQFNLVSFDPFDGAQRIGISLRPSTSADAGVGTSSVRIDQTLLLDYVDTAYSWTEVAVVAWLGSTNPAGLLMQNQSGIQVDQMTSQTAPPLAMDGPPLYAFSAISGFSYQFTQPQAFLGLGAGVGATASPFNQKPSVSAVASGIWTCAAPFSGTVDAALIATTVPPADLGFGLRYLADAPLGSTEVDPLPDLNGAAVGSAAFLMQSFFCQLGAPAGLLQAQMGVGSESMNLNFPKQGAITAYPSSLLRGWLGQEIPASNLIVNYLVAETPQADALR